MTLLTITLLFSILFYHMFILGPSSQPWLLQSRDAWPPVVPRWLILFFPTSEVLLYPIPFFREELPCSEAINFLDVPVSACTAKWDTLLVTYCWVSQETYLIFLHCKGYGYHRLYSRNSFKKYIQIAKPNLPILDAVRYEGLLRGGHWE